MVPKLFTQQHFVSVCDPPLHIGTFHPSTATLILAWCIGGGPGAGDEPIPCTLLSGSPCPRGLAPAPHSGHCSLVQGVAAPSGLALLPHSHWRDSQSKLEQVVWLLQRGGWAKPVWCWDPMCQAAAPRVGSWAQPCRTGAMAVG